MGENKVKIEEVLNALSKSKFRSSFHLKKQDFDYIDKIGNEKLKQHAYDFVNSRLRKKLVNDGKQTPFRGHPVFVAQHATACCCRGCLEKWHHISSDCDLSDEQVEYVVDVILSWINREKINKNSKNY